METEERDGCEGEHIQKARESVRRSELKTRQTNPQPLHPAPQIHLGSSLPKLVPRLHLFAQRMHGKARLGKKVAV